jgi:hypothetical protein
MLFSTVNRNRARSRAAESRLGEISPETVAIVRVAMVRLREADRAGDKAACEQALEEVQRAIGPSLDIRIGMRAPSAQ